MITFQALEMMMVHQPHLVSVEKHGDDDCVVDLDPGLSKGQKE